MHTIKPLEDRDIEFDSLTPAGVVLNALFDGKLNGPKIDEGRKDLIDPFRANHESLANPEVRNGVFKLFRSAELVCSLRMSYRVLWESVTALLLGDQRHLLRRTLRHFLQITNQRITMT